MKLFTLLYVDDTIVLAETEGQLQKSLVALYEYCELWGLKVNVDKTKIVIFSGGSRPITKHKNLFFGSRPLEVVPDYTKAIEKQISQVTKAM